LAISDKPLLTKLPNQKIKADFESKKYSDKNYNNNSKAGM
jgi:hypothetical protein